MWQVVRHRETSLCCVMDLAMVNCKAFKPVVVISSQRHLFLPMLLVVGSLLHVLLVIVMILDLVDTVCLPLSTQLLPEIVTWVGHSLISV